MNQIRYYRWKLYFNSIVSVSMVIESSSETNDKHTQIQSFTEYSLWLFQKQKTKTENNNIIFKLSRTTTNNQQNT